VKKKKIKLNDKEIKCIFFLKLNEKKVSRARMRF
jgi:hypothetical protein